MCLDVVLEVGTLAVAIILVSNLSKYKFLLVYDTFNSFCYSGFVSGIFFFFYSFLWDCTVYT